MKRSGIFAVALAAALLAAAAVVAYVERGPLANWYQTVGNRRGGTHTPDAEQKSDSGQRKILYYRNPMNPQITSPVPMKDEMGMDYVPVYEDQAQKPAGQRKILYYRNPMNPQITSPVPMKDEMGMDYVPVYEDQARQVHPGVYISPEKQQLIGVKTGLVEMRRLAGEIRTVGRVAYDPNLFTAQEEYLQILKGRSVTQRAGSSVMNEQSDLLLRGARYRLMLRGMSETEIDAMEKRGTPETNLFLPTSEDKNVWVYVTVYEYEAALVKEGMAVYVDTLAYPGEIFKGSVVSLTPLLEAATRTMKARALVENPEGRLKLEMFANVRMDYDLGERLAVPEGAVMHAGTRDIVYLTDPNGYFEPRTVELGVKAQGYHEVLKGLAGGEVVVTSANFLVDSESKLNSVLSQMGEPNQSATGHQHGSTP